MAEKPAIELMTRPGCCLCDQAAALLRTVDPQAEWPLRSVDIRQSIEHLERYATRIPVLRREDTGAELDWPFDQQALQRFLEQ